MLKTMEQPSVTTCYNPATGDFIGNVPSTTDAQVMQAKAELDTAGVYWRQKPLKERSRILKQFQGVLIDSLDEITAVINKDCGKSRQDALLEVYITVDMLNNALKKAPKWLKREYIMPGLYLSKLCYTERRAMGTVAVISPWNFPFMLALQPVLTALIAGNTVMLKPSEVTAITGQLIERLIKQVPDLAPYVRVLHGDGATGAAVVASKPDLIYLTGSTRTGKAIAKAAAEHMIPVVFELGGKDPLIVLEDADVAAAARWAIWGSCWNAGQACAGTERVYVVNGVYNEFVQHAVAEAKKYSVGYDDEIKSRFHMGPLSSERQAAIVDEQLKDALDKGATVLAGGERNGLLMEATVLGNVDHSMKLMHEETFGPILPIMRVKDSAEAIKYANQSEYGLGVSVWGQIAHARKVASEVEAGTKAINDTMSHFAIPNLPFGGVKQSGNGRSHDKQDMLNFTQTESYAISVPPLPFDPAVIMRQPGNYRIGETLMKVSFGVTPAQRLAPIQQALESQKAKQLFEKASDMLPGKSAMAAAAAAVGLGSIKFLRDSKK